MSSSQAGLRRSARARVQNKRYTDDAFAELDTSDMPEELTEALQDTQSPGDDPQSGDEFVANEDQEVPDDDNKSNSSEPTLDGQESDTMPLVSEQGESNKQRSVKQKRPIRKPVSGKSKVKVIESDDKPYSRRIPTQPKYSYKPYHILNSYSDLDPYREAIVKAIFQWFADLTFPSRLPDSEGAGGFRHSFFLSDAQISEFESAGRDWYLFKGGRQLLQAGSELLHLDSQQCQAYLNPQAVSRPVLFGSSSHHTLHHAAPCKPIRLCNYAPGQTPSSNTTGLSGVLPNQGSHWVINAGETVQCVDWAPSNANASQYLALSTWSKDKASKSSSFASSDRSPATIQIWECFGVETAGEGLTIHNEIPPRLILVFCFDCGLVKHLKWCPFKTVEPSLQQDQQGLNIGLLALVSTDGVVRLVDVEVSRTPSEFPQYIHCKSAAFESQPPDTVFTCVTWISPSILAAGCANGFVAVWDLASAAKNQRFPRNATPIMYQSLHSTFITSIVSCQPSHPNYVLTSSMDGLIRLTDIRNPNMDSSFSNKSRLGTIPLVWQEQLQHLYGADETQYLKCINIRRLHRIFRSCEVEASVLCLASSSVHTSILIGTADGSVICTNPLRSLLEMRYVKTNSRFRQKWFSHEWRRGHPVGIESEYSRDMDNIQAAQNTNGKPLDFSNGLCRIVVDYPPTERASRPAWEQDREEPRSTPQKKQNARNKKRAASPTQNRYSEVRHGPSGVPFTTLHEEETGVRCVAWHPDIKCGGWAAAGLGSGLLVVGDLAVDRK